MKKKNNLIIALSTISFSVTIYGFLKNKSIEELVNKIEEEKNKNKIINENYQELLTNKLNESEIAKIVSNEKLNNLIQEMNE